MSDDSTSEHSSTPEPSDDARVDADTREVDARERAARNAEEMVGQLYYDFVIKEAQRKRNASHLAGALLRKVANDFGSVPPPPIMSVTTESDSELEAASDAPLSDEERAVIESMRAPKGLFGKLLSLASFGASHERKK